MTGEAPVLYERLDRVAVITLNRPGALNAFDLAMYAGFNAAIERFRDDADAFVAVVAASGERAFSAGVDLKALARDMEAGDVRGYGVLDFVDDLVTAKPIVAAVQGHCIGEGVNVALACDLIVAEEGTRFAVPEARVGVSALDVPLALARKIGYGPAFALMVPGEPRDAAWAERLGLVEIVAPAGEARAVAIELAGRIAGDCAPLAVQAMKETLWRAVHQDEATARAAGLRWRERILASEDFGEGRAAFAAKRKPVFRGR